MFFAFLDDPNKIHLKDEPTEESFQVDELSTCPNSLVKVYSDGRVSTIRVKRMAETCKLHLIIKVTNNVNYLCVEK